MSVRTGPGSKSLAGSKYRKSMLIHKGVLPANQVCMNLIQPFTGVDKPEQADYMVATDLFRDFWGSVKPESRRNGFN